MDSSAIIIQISKFAIKFLDVSQMMDIVFHMKIVIFQPKINVMALLLLEYNVFGILKLRVALNFKHAIDYLWITMIAILYLIAFKRRNNARVLVA